MRINRLVASAATAALVATTFISVSAPAQAKVDLPTTTTLTASNTEPVAFGDTVSFSGDIKDATGSYARGVATLWVSSSKTPTWTAVTSYEGSSFYFSSIKPKSNSLYKVTYAGGLDYSGANNYLPSESAPVEVAVKRVVKVKLNKLTIKGKVKPKYKNKKILIKKIVGKKLKKYKKVRTNKKSVFTFRAPNKRGFKFAVVIPGDKHYAGWANPYQVYRPVAAKSTSLRPAA